MIISNAICFLSLIIVLGLTFGIYKSIGNSSAESFQKEFLEVLNTHSEKGLKVSGVEKTFEFPDGDFRRSTNSNNPLNAVVFHYPMKPSGIRLRSLLTVRYLHGSILRCLMRSILMKQGQSLPIFI